MDIDQSSIPLRESHDTVADGWKNLKLSDSDPDLKLSDMYFARASSNSSNLIKKQEPNGLSLPPESEPQHLSSPPRFSLRRSPFYEHQVSRGKHIDKAKLHIVPSTVINDTSSQISRVSGKSNNGEHQQ